jgi:hypothetical protein
MLTCYLKGGLGNQLFEIITTISYAIKYNKNVYFINHKHSDGGRNTYWDSIFDSLKLLLLDNYIQSSYIINELEYSYNEIYINDKFENIIIDGYFQSYKYFDKYYDLIYNILNIENKKKKLSNQFNNFNNTVSLHFRIGDYKNLEYHPIMPFNYYINSLNYIKSINPNINYTIIYFNEEEDREIVNNNILKLKELFKNFNFIKCDNKYQDWEQLLLMSCCTHNIIANSSFSWWGAYFNNNNKIVCYPSLWFGPGLDHNNTKDLCPPEWIKIDIN